MRDDGASHSSPDDGCRIHNGYHNTMKQHGWEGGKIAIRLAAQTTATATANHCTACHPQLMANEKKASAMSLPRSGRVAKRQAGHSARMR
jgi:hypothetical protein